MQVLYYSFIVVFTAILAAALALPKYEHFAATFSQGYKNALMRQMATKPYGLEYTTNPHGRMIYDLFPNRMCQINRFYDSMLIDGADLLTTRHCLEIDNQGRTLQENMDAFSTGQYAFYVKKIEMQTSKMRDVYKSIVLFLKDFKETISPDRQLQGPALLLLFQAPYYRDTASNLINVTENNVESYNYQPHILLNKPLTDTGLPTFENKIVAYVLLPMHDVHGYLKNIPATNVSSYLASCLSWLRTNKSKSKMCKMICLDDSSTFCGCINTSATPSKTIPYQSVCATTDTPPKIRDFGMLYRINENSPYVGNLFTNTFIPDLDLE